MIGLLLAIWLAMYPSAPTVAAGAAQPAQKGSDTANPSQTVVATHHPQGYAVLGLPRLVATHCSGYRIDCAPSLSFNEFRRVFVAHHTRLSEADIAFAYADGKAWGIDPAWMLAFWCRESTCASRGNISLSHLNGGNVKAGGSYRWYPSWHAAIDDWYVHMKRYYVDAGIVYVWEVVAVYFPASSDGNDPTAYTHEIEGWVRFWRLEDQRGGK